MGEKYKSTPEQLELELERLVRAINDHAEFVADNQDNLTDEILSHLVEDHKRIYQMFMIIMEHTGSQSLAAEIIARQPPQPIFMHPRYMGRSEWVAKTKKTK